MPLPRYYIYLLKLTGDAGTSVSDLEAYLGEIREAWVTLGGGDLQLFVTLGVYDAVAIGTMADEPKAAAFAMYLAREDLFHTVTMRAYPDDQVGAVVEYMAPLPTIIPVRH